MSKTLLHGMLKSWFVSSSFLAVTCSVISKEESPKLGTALKICYYDVWVILGLITIESMHYSAGYVVHSLDKWDAKRRKLIHPEHYKHKTVNVDSF
jgi:hypothetical protein